LTNLRLTAYVLAMHQRTHLRDLRTIETPGDVVPPDDYRDFFARKVAEHLPDQAEVLEVGAGPALFPKLRPIRVKARWICGVDPRHEVLTNPDLDEKHCGFIESVDLGDRLFDGAFAHHVTEHVAEPHAFLDAISRRLKPGAWFWALTPNAGHPFCVLSRALEVVGLKGVLRRLCFTDDHGSRVNEYPAYYRLSRGRDVGRVGAEAGFVAAECYFLPVGFEGYLPRGLRWVSSAYDRIIAPTWFRRRLILAFGLQRAL
jgi:SAM-dependent methyltransferase